MKKEIVRVPDGSHWKVNAPLGWSPDPGIVCPELSLTDQSQKKDCDINVIVARCAQSGVAPGMRGEPIYGDFTSVPDYQTALEIVARAEEQFMGLDAKTRARFDNDPEKLLAFVDDDKNYDEALALGLIPKKPVADSGAAPAAPSAPAAPAGSPSPAGAASA